MIEYAEQLGFSGEQVDRLLALIPKIDKAWLKRLEEKRPKTPTPPKKRR